MQRSGEIGNIQDKIVYVTKLFNEEMHLVVRQDITSIEQLRGKKVNFSDIGSGTQLSTRNIFSLLGIKAEEVNMGQADAFEALKRGDIAATVLIAGKPAGAMGRIKYADGFRFLPVPFAKPLQTDYLPAVLSAEDYPGMIEPGKTIETVAVSAVLIAYNWPKNTDRYRRIEKFVEAFFPRVGEFSKPPRHKKWREANLTAVIPGWTRFAGADEWLQKNRPQAKPAAERRDFELFLDGRGISAAERNALAPADRDRLFQEFLKWNQARARQ